MSGVFSRSFACVVLWTAATSAASAASLRPPAVPLVACDPYFSIWSAADTLTGADTTHWTGKPHRLASLIRVDGNAFRVMGSEPASLTPLTQIGLSVLPTRSIYHFADAGVELTLTFLTPALPDDLDVLARPVTYVIYELASTDGASHDVEIYFEASAELAVDTPDQEVSGQIASQDDLVALKIGSTRQRILARKGDDLRIDWGYLYAAAPSADVSASRLADGTSLRAAFADQGAAGIAGVDSAGDARPAAGLAAALTLRVGAVSQAKVTRWLMLAYDDLYSIQYMKQNLRPYWRRNGWEAADLLRASARELEELRRRCEAFDQELVADLTAAGGEQYAQIAALAYRQCFAAGKFVVDAQGQPLQFSKENHSNGCIGTADVFYPMAPQFLLFGPTLAKSFLVPFMNYAASDRWKFPFAPHDLGQYPHANGQVYGGGEVSEENQMPVEECGNLLLLMAAVAQMEGHAEFAGLYWTQLSQWAAYLRAKGFDPENQLCTDDFAGHLAHNVNLSAKAICGLAAFGKLCALRGETDLADEYRRVAREFAARWIETADDGDHFRLAFDRPGTWSQKYNLVWDRLLDLNLFPDAVLRKEMDFYRRHQNRYGLPLDNRSNYTKLDWILWTATLTRDRSDFAALVTPVHRFLDETPDRVPMTDWYFTDTGRRRGFTARPVVGGVFLELLYDRPLWAKYAERDRTRASGWAPLPKMPRRQPLVATSEREAQRWRYTLQTPVGSWMTSEFDDQSWLQGDGGFGTDGTPGAVVRTRWNGPQIWLRRSFELHEPLPQRVALRIHHDEDVEVYVNGKLAFSGEGYTTSYETEEIDRQLLRRGRNVLAVHCLQTRGGQYIDVGLDALVARQP